VEFLLGETDNPPLIDCRYLHLSYTREKNDTEIASHTRAPRRERNGLFRGATLPRAGSCVRLVALSPG
jgi:hypothetical protein